MKRKLLCVGSVLLIMAGIGAIAGAQLAQDQGGLESGMLVFLRIAGIAAIVGAVLCVYCYLGEVIQNDEELEREEKDERNEMIRGKAAQNTILVMTILMLVAELIFICLEYLIPALMVGMIMFVGVMGHLLMIGYYQKKY